MTRSLSLTVRATNTFLFNLIPMSIDKGVGCGQYSVVPPPPEVLLVKGQNGAVAVDPFLSLFLKAGFRFKVVDGFGARAGLIRLVPVKLDPSEFRHCSDLEFVSMF